MQAELKALCACSVGWVETAQGMLYACLQSAVEVFFLTELLNLQHKPEFTLHSLARSDKLNHSKRTLEHLTLALLTS